MAYIIVTTANANKDIQDAIDWENSRDAGLGKKFYDDLSEKFSDLADVPAMGSFRYKNVRCVATKVFQYLIHYTIYDTVKEVVILRVLHQRRQPVWQ